MNQSVCFIFLQDGRYRPLACFHMLKAHSETCPVDLNHQDQITIYFMICCASLPVFRLMEKSGYQDTYCTVTHIIRILTSRFVYADWSHMQACKGLASKTACYCDLFSDFVAVIVNLIESKLMLPCHPATASAESLYQQ